MIKKFTLLELITVSAIIGILITILLPSLTKARKSSLTAVCMHNLKQQSVALQLYIKEESVIPSLKLPDNGGHWGIQKRVKIEIAEDGSPFMCPEDDAFKINPIDGSYSQHEISYGLNRKVAEAYLAQVVDPAETILTADSGHEGDSHPYADRRAAGFNLNNSSGFPAPIGPRHLGGGNVLWIDSHVSLIKDTITIHTTDDKWALE